MVWSHVGRIANHLARHGYGRRVVILISKVLRQTKARESRVELRVQTFR